jgi:hypothetical protein
VDTFKEVFHDVALAGAPTAVLAPGGRVWLNSALVKVTAHIPSHPVGWTLLFVASQDIS